MSVIDIHSHWIPAEWAELVQKEGGANGAKVGKNDRGQVTLDLPGFSYVFRDEYSNIERRIDAMQAAGIGMHVLSFNSPTVYWAPPAFGLKLAQLWNDKCAEVVQTYPQHFPAGLATLPLHTPELALEELERAAKLPGLRGVYTTTTVNGANLDEKRFFPIYARCEQLEWPIFVHPFNLTSPDPRMSKYHLRNLLGNPYETGIAAASLLFGGVLDAFPKLDIVLAHGGGAFPALVGRMDHGAAVRAEAKLSQPPSTYVRRFYYDTITHNDQILMNLIRQVGTDRVMLGSDYPADMSYTRPADIVQRLNELSADERDMILGGNAMRLLRL